MFFPSGKSIFAPWQGWKLFTIQSSESVSSSESRMYGSSCVPCCGRGDMCWAGTGKEPIDKAWGFAGTLEYYASGILALSEDINGDVHFSASPIRLLMCISKIFSEASLLLMKYCRVLHSPGNPSGPSQLMVESCSTLQTCHKCC